MRRLAGVVAAVAAIATVGLVPSAPSGAEPSEAANLRWTLNIDSVLCDPTIGQWQYSWRLRNDDVGLTITFTSVIVNDTGAETVGTWTPNPFTSGEWTRGVALFPGSARSGTGITIQYTANGVPGQLLVPVGDWGPNPCLQAADLVVSPAVTQPGATVTVSGTGCLQPLAPIVDDFGTEASSAPAASNSSPLSGTVSGSVAFAPPVAFGPITAAPDGSWSTTVVVPPGTPPGSYPVSVTCTYPPLPITMATAQAVTPTSFAYQTRTITLPVVAAPKFTG